MTKQTTIVVIGSLRIKGTEHIESFSPFFTRKTTFLASCIVLHTKPLLVRGFTLKGKNLLLSERTLFQKGDKPRKGKNLLSQGGN